MASCMHDFEHAEVGQNGDNDHGFSALYISMRSGSPGGHIGGGRSHLGHDPAKSSSGALSMQLHARGLITHMA